MKISFISLLALGVAAAMAGPADRALAGEPMVLSDAQLDQVTAGFPFAPFQIDVSSRGGTVSGRYVFGDWSTSFDIDVSGPVDLRIQRDFDVPRHTPEWTDFNTHDPGRR